MRQTTAYTRYKRCTKPRQKNTVLCASEHVHTQKKARIDVMSALESFGAYSKRGKKNRHLCTKTILYCVLRLPEHDFGAFTQNQHESEGLEENVMRVPKYVHTPKRSIDVVSALEFSSMSPEGKKTFKKNPKETRRVSLTAAKQNCPTWN